MKNQTIYTFYSKNEVFAKKNSLKCTNFILKLEFCTQKCTFGPEKTKIVLFTLYMKFLPNNFTKMYKFWIKTGVWYPKMYISFRKREKFVLFTLIMKFLPKNFTKMYKFWIKTVALYPTMYFGPEKTKKIVLFTKNEVFANVQILNENCSFVPKNVHLVPKKKIVLFTLKIKFLQKIFTKMYKFCIKTGVLYPKMYIWTRKNKKNCTFYTKNEVFAK